MQGQKSQSSIISFRNQVISVVGKITEKVDWNKIDKHESLSFLSKNYQKNPSDIAKILIVVLIVFFLMIEGFRLITIFMCYVFPTGIMILRVCEAMKSQNAQSNKFAKKQKSKNDQVQSKQSFLKNDSMLSTNSKQGKQQLAKEEQHVSFKVQEQKMKQASSIDQEKQKLLSNSNKKSQGVVKQNSIEQQLSLQQVQKVFIFYFIVNLILDVFDPVIILGIQTIYSFLGTIIVALYRLVTEGDFLTLLVVPFQLLGKFIVNLFDEDQISNLTQITLVAVRIFVSVLLLKLNRLKLASIEKIFMFKIQKQIFPQIHEQHPKND